MSLSDNVFIELADAWEAQTATETSKDRRECLRECADAIRMLVGAKKASAERFCPHADPFVYCDTCKVSPCPLGLDK